ncbi:MAG TPA: ATP-binding protein [Draconibacterium sp.]|nr:ATP-binding protein [Draconibacterium sp.]
MNTSPKTKQKQGLKELQKLLEQKNRELEVEAALEKVRSRSLEMKTSEELQKVVSVVFEQLQSLNFALDGAAFIATRIKEFKGFDFWMEDKVTQPARFRLPYYNAPSINDFYVAWDNQQDFVAKIYGEEKNLWFDYAFKNTDLKIVPEERKKWILEQSYLTQAFAIQKNSMIGIHVHHEKTLTDNETDILKRFSKVFEQTYTRFLDLKKAEEHVREARIETALERIRSRSITMSKSEEIAEIAGKIFSELKQLDLALNRVLIWTFNDTEKYTTWWSSNPEIENTAESYRIDYNENPVFINYLQAWQKRVPIHLYTLSGDTKKIWEDYLFEHTEMSRLPIAVRKGMREEDTLFTISVISDYGLMMSGSFEPLSDAHIDIIQRFGRVFQQSYTRFIDLQKAEKQAREAEIESSLERVRAKAMAMRSSKDISGATKVVFNEISRLGIRMERCGIVIIKSKTPVMEVWTTPLSPQNKQVVEVITSHLDSRIHPLLQGVYKSWKNGEKYFVYELKGKEVREYYETLGKVQEYRFPRTDAHTVHQINNSFFFNHGQIFAFTIEPLSDEEKQIFFRFTKVFSHTYRRYVDIVNAEKQAREAQIEASLERVRSKALAMHSSKDISGATAIVFDELTRLGIKMERCGIVILNEPPIMEVWSTLLSHNVKKASKVINGKLNSDSHIMLQEIYKAWKGKKEFFSYTLIGDEVRKYYDYLEKEPGYRFPKVSNYPKQQVANCFNFSEGYVFAITINSLSENEKYVIQRFTNVFSLTYQRYLDIVKAEKQAREAQIEASLERVRSKALAMHSSKDISGATAIVFDELTRLGIIMERCGIVILNETPVMEVWSTLLSRDNKKVSEVINGKLNVERHVMLQKSYKAWTDKKEFFSHKLVGDEVQNYYETLEKEPGYRFPKVSDYPKQQIAHCFIFSEGYVFVYSVNPLSEDEKHVVARFTNAFSLTYQRYLDIVKAEKQAHEAVKQASLDRVRGEIASMRTSKDLNRITPVIWRELQALEVPFIRCGVFIIDEENEKVQVFLSTPKGKALGVLNLSFDVNELTKNTVVHWRKKQIFKAHWNKQEFINWINSMMQLGQVESAETYQGSASAPESLNLHFIPFKQGMLYVGDVSPLNKDNLEMVDNLAKVFSIAYARYEDFNHLETAKVQIEKTLYELKAAQTQLIQTEKMASLGELTAGIAHEIQNPLNFVNNFSEVSTELLYELKEEIENGNNGEVNEIIDDVVQNLEKINHHGKRAEGIVKGMLLHSRGSSGQKEPTDINALADEYLRLSFHGYRAKDKSFNADFKLEADETLPKTEVVPQDIGRVLLNLINNAFYVVNEKAKQNIGGYKPSVVVTTAAVRSPSGDLGVKICVKDNGSGIPDYIKDKIFQPFFTTKPTGQGTGLGLSLSYDIVKAHGGEIKVESTKGEGTTFIIQIPNR